MSGNTAEGNDDEKSSEENTGAMEKPLDEKIDEIVEDRVQEKVEQELKERDVTDQKTKADSESSEMSRRSFLKKLGAGALGLGAMSLPTVSALNFRADDLEFYGADSTKEFVINDGGPVEVRNSSFKVRGSNLQRSFAATLSSHKLSSGEFTALDRFTVPSGSSLRIYVVGITNNSFNTPSGLNVIVRNQSTGTNELTYNINHSEGEPLDELTSVAGDNIVIAADNGNFGTGTGSTQVTTARVKYEIV